LNYFDEFAQQAVVVEQTIEVEMVSNLSGYDPAWDLEILRNVTVQQTAEGMRQIDRLFQAERYEEAWQLAANLERQLAEVARLTQDEQMAKDVELMRRYQQTLVDALWQAEGRAPLQNDTQGSTPAGERPYRGNLGDRPAPTPAAPVLEIR
jgi:hypothetical protein